MRFCHNRSKRLFSFLHTQTSLSEVIAVTSLQRLYASGLWRAACCFRKAPELETTQLIWEQSCLSSSSELCCRVFLSRWWGVSWEEALCLLTLSARCKLHLIDRKQQTHPPAFPHTQLFAWNPPTRRCRTDKKPRHSSQHQDASKRKQKARLPVLTCEHISKFEVKSAVPWEGFVKGLDKAKERALW